MDKDTRKALGDLYTFLFYIAVLTVMLLIFLAFANKAKAQWGPSGCATVVASASQTVADSYSWRTRADDPDRIYLYKNGVQIGGYDEAAGYYRPCDPGGSTWGDPGPAPVEPPARSRHFFGVDNSKLTGLERYTIHTKKGCKDIGREDAKKIMVKGLEDDSSKLRVTVIGSEERRKQVMSDIAAKAPELNDWAVIRDYPPDHWTISQAGFVTTGMPTIYCQTPTGKVLHRQDDYQGGVDELVGAIRKAKANYDKRNDADLRKSFPILNNLDLSKITPYVIALVIGAGAGWLFIKRKAVN